jgi:hypothetical protein
MENQFRNISINKAWVSPSRNEIFMYTNTRPVRPVG